MDRDVNASTEAVRKLALIAEVMERRAAEALQAQQQATQALSQTLADTRRDIERATQASLAQVAQTVKDSLNAALGQTAARYDQEVDEASSRLRVAAQGFERSSALTRAMAHHKLLAAYLATAGALALLVLGGFGATWYQWRSFNDARARAEAAQMDAATIAAYAQVGVTSCGGRPCVKLDKKAPRWGSKGEYVLLETSGKSGHAVRSTAR
jgi:hypothetical protein